MKKLKFDDVSNQNDNDEQKENTPDNQTIVEDVGRDRIGSETDDKCLIDEKNLSHEDGENSIKSSQTLNAQMDPSRCERFQLVSIICHRGRSTDVGHYVSYVYNFEHSKWFLCNDISVKEVSFENLINGKFQYCRFGI